MTNQIQSIDIEKLIPHPDNPNRMSKAIFTRLIRNIKLTGRYEPLVVRPHPERGGYFQVINGHHRLQALSELGQKKADAVVWDVDDQQADILLATLNRLAGTDIVDKKIALLGRLSTKIQPRELAKLLPQTARQIERLTNLKDSLNQACRVDFSPPSLTNPLVFFISDKQQRIIEEAMSLAQKYLTPKSFDPAHDEFIAGSSASRKAAALTAIAEEYLAVKNEKNLSRAQSRE
ncbi:MAG: ParB/RepB/Spo0J family partition protein [Sedimentisphaerales bacterium]|nr:ParB/RepB/Spo0J family partition protein [Sedimentisphaerales bacterium]